jgi:2-phosphoglycerate kinase
MSAGTRVILIGGSSHTGKSTLTSDLARLFRWKSLSTDQLARHPGRPWRDDDTPLPDDVIEYYRNPTGEDLLAGVLEHYQSNVWPIADALIRSHLNNPYDPRLVFEGSGLLPENVSASAFPRVKSIWLYGDRRLITNRIQLESKYADRDDDSQGLIDAFCNRSTSFNDWTVSEVRKHGLNSLDVTDKTQEEILDAALNILNLGEGGNVER